MPSPFFGVIPLDLGNRDLARLSNSTIGVGEVPLENRDGGSTGYCTHGLGCLARGDIKSMRVK
jgi:hypothetical protein